MDREQGIDQNALGPGVYFTRDKTQAIGYAESTGFLYSVKINTSAERILVESKKPDRKRLSRFIDLAPKESRYYGLTNWDVDPVQAKSLAISAYAKFEDELGALLGIYHDFYGSDWKSYARSMTSIGYDAYLHHLPAVDHLIVFNPKVIKIVGEESVAEIKKTGSVKMTIRYRGFLYCLAMSSEPLQRALERIKQLRDRGRDPHKGTLLRLNKTQDPGKIEGIALAARQFHWKDIITLAKEKYKAIVGRPLLV
jgi:hypothetical protein